MGRQAKSLDWERIARIGALALGCAALANCSAPLTGVDSKHSQRVVEEGEPVPKGGGVYRVGRPYSIRGRTYVPADDPTYRAEGIASWYGPDFHGRLTANGEVYDMHGISAAHPTLPLPSYARVTNIENDRSIIVRVNDRGPYARERIADLSIGTAKALGFYGSGLAKVRVEYVGRAPLAGSDDRMLMATLREGSPAPAPSKVMVASARPFLPNPDGKPAAASGGRAPIAVAAARTGSQVSANEHTSTVRPQTNSRSTATAELRIEQPAPAWSWTPALGFAPRGEGSALGFMSGRGLY